MPLPRLLKIYKFGPNKASLINFQFLIMFTKMTNNCIIQIMYKAQI